MTGPLAPVAITGAALGGLGYYLCENDVSKDAKAAYEATISAAGVAGEYTVYGLEVAVEHAPEYAGIAKDYTVFGLEVAAEYTVVGLKAAGKGIGVGVNASLNFVSSFF